MGFVLSSVGEVALSIDAKTVQSIVAEGRFAELKSLGREVLPIMARLYESSDTAQRARVAETFYSLGWKSAEAKRVLMKDVHTTGPAASPPGAMGSGSRKQRRRRCGGTP